MKNFLDIGIPSELTDVLGRLNIVNPTEIQELAIPSALRGDDILASAQTGTGKTLAF
ncbi:MAG: DEAD/DEAH box helicase, partial [Proteobacteria bacterium]|nr:DEAD/DEAH box helicase [Pseudomonadota bacterium]